MSPDKARPWISGGRLFLPQHRQPADDPPDDATIVRAVTAVEVATGSCAPRSLPALPTELQGVVQRA